eukprot:2808983-Prymnesium_polylepis.1
MERATTSTNPDRVRAFWWPMASCEARVGADGAARATRTDPDCTLFTARFRPESQLIQQRLPLARGRWRLALGGAEAKLDLRRMAKGGDELSRHTHAGSAACRPEGGA